MTSKQAPIEPVDPRRVIQMNIEEEMKTSYIDYAMSVIIGRAIPDVRDGLKPVHRRTLYAMWEEGNTSDKPYKKSARAVAATMGKYHPHGDSSIYDTLVKMAQPFSYRAPLVDGQGNFGSVDGDSAAAMRYTEARLTKYAEALLTDLEKETVDFIPNFDSSTSEPTVLPCRVPNLLVNGSSGIAVGMATNMAPHNLREVAEAVKLVIDRPHCTVDDLLKVLPGPDFPTGGIIMGRAGIRSAYETGHGKLTVRGVAEIEDVETKVPKIIISELPFQVNKARLVEHIAELVKEKRIEGISDLRDESDKDGMRVVIELRKGVMPKIILNQLYKHTSLESTFGVINLAISEGQPKTLGVRGLIDEFLRHRVEVVRRRCGFELRKARDRLHIIDGLLIALDRIDEVIATIRASESAEAAGRALIERFGLSELQAAAILAMQLRRLAALEQTKLRDERLDLLKTIERLELILSCEANVLREIRKEVVAAGKEFGNERRTRISEEESDLNIIDLIPDVPMLDLDHGPELHQAPPARDLPRPAPRRARRDRDGDQGGGPGRQHLPRLDARLPALLHHGRTALLAQGLRDPRGLAHEQGQGDREPAQPPGRARHGRDPDARVPRGPVPVLLDAAGAGGQGRHERVLAPAPVGDQRDLAPRGRPPGRRQADRRHAGADPLDGEGPGPPLQRAGGPAHGPRRPGRARDQLKYGDELVATTLVEQEHLLTITAQGAGKRTDFDEFRGHGRGTMGVRNILAGPGNPVVATRAVSPDEEVVLITALGNVIRIRAADISIQKRSTRGVRMIRLEESDRVVGFAAWRRVIDEIDAEDEAADTAQQALDSGNPVE